MNILFLSVYEINDSDSGYIYADLIREFSKHDHNIFAVTPTRNEKTSVFTDCNNVKIIKVKNGQIQKTNKIKKVINLLTLENKAIKAVKRFSKSVKFDLVINMTSNLSFLKTMSYFKKRDKAISYLLLKDIFPQNAVDMEMLKPDGLMGFVYRHFKKKEKKLYKNSDYIGCMSQANLNYIFGNNPYIDRNKLTVVPNSIEANDVSLSAAARIQMREKYAIPTDKVVFVYGGNLGKPQGIPFIIECLKSQINSEKAFFFIVGDGTEYGKLEKFMDEYKPENIMLLKRLPREDYDRMIAACDVGLIFLDYHFTVPNFPSRLLSYMQAGLPVLACTDTNTDVGQVIVDNDFGWQCVSNGTDGFGICVEAAVKEHQQKAKNANKLLDSDFSVSSCYQTIINGIR